MDNFYPTQDAKLALQRIFDTCRTTTKGFPLASVTKEWVDQNFKLQPFRETFRFFDRNVPANEADEMVLIVPGAMYTKDLPPVKARKKSKRKYIAQSLHITGLHTDGFDNAEIGLDNVLDHISGCFPTEPEPFFEPPTFAGHSALSFSTRYLTPAHQIRQDEYLEVPRSIDPHNILIKLMDTDFGYCIDNEVLYASVVDEGDERGIRAIPPSTFKPGDIVEVHFSPRVVPGQNGTHSIKLALRVVTLLDSSFTNAASSQRKLSRSSSMPEFGLKRRALDTPSTDIPFKKFRNMRLSAGPSSSLRDVAQPAP